MAAATIFKKSKIRHTSATVWPIVAKFDKVMHIRSLTHIFPNGS